MMTSENAVKTKKVSQYVIIILCWLVYVLAYLGRYSYNANITLIIDDYSVTKAQAGLVATFFFFAYGVGQVVNGIMSRRYNKRWLFPIALTLSSAINLLVFFKIPFFAIKYLWLLNGFVQSCLWSGIISVISKTVDEKRMTFAMLLLGTTTCAGTVITYGASSVFAYLNNYRLMFLSAAVIMTALGIIWFLVYSPSLEIRKSAGKTEDEKHSGNTGDTFLGLIIMIGVFAVIHNFIKDGLTTWLPDILKERYMLGDSMSILLTVILPLLGVFGTVAAISTVNLLKDFVKVIALFFAVSAVSVGITVFSPSINVLISVVLFGIVECMMHGINNVVTSVLPLKLRGNVDSGKIAGILNGCCYLGSTISSYGLGKLADFGGWQMVLNIIFAVCIISALIGILYNGIAKKSP